MIGFPHITVGSSVWVCRVSPTKTARRYYKTDIFTSLFAVMPLDEGKIPDYIIKPSYLNKRISTVERTFKIIVC